MTRIASVGVVILATRIARRRREAAELPLNQPGKGDSGAVFEVRADDLDADRQTGLRAGERRHGRREAGGGGELRPQHEGVEVRVRSAVNADVTLLDRL